MKKIYGIIAASTIISNMQAYEINIKNETDGEIVATLFYGGGFFCTQETVKIPSHEARTKNTGGCCPSSIHLNATGGTANTKKGYYGSEIVYTPPTTGLGLSCRGSTVKISNKEDGSGTLKAEAE